VVFIRVNRHRIGENQKYDNLVPPIAVQLTKSGKPIYGHRIVLQTDPPVEIVYEKENPMHCGARVWITTAAKAEIHKGGADVICTDPGQV